MTKMRSVGIDVSKAKLDVCIMPENKHLQVANNHNGATSLIRRLSQYQDKESTPIVIEATGGYHNDITFALKDKDFKVCIINPLITKKYSRSSVRKTKTDKVDASILAEIGISEELHEYKETREQFQDKKKVRLYYFLKKQLQHIRNKKSGSENSFEKQILESTEKHLVEQMMLVKEEIMKSMPVKSGIYGVSDFSMKVIRTELGDLSRFNNRRQVVAFAGIDPSIRESGTSVHGRSRISKRGSKTLRHALFQASWGLMMHNKKFKEYYNKKRSEGKHYYTCLIAISRMLINQIYQNNKSTT